MATRDTEGRREIEAARQRLSAAKSHASFISKAEDTAKQMFDTAKKNLEDIQLQSISSKKEVEDAQKLLKEAEKRWEVIEIDLDDQECNAGGNVNKKRKLSVVSPQGIDNNEGSVTVTIPYQQGRKLGFMLVDVYTNRQQNQEDLTTRIIISSSSAIFKFKDQLFLKRGVFDDVDELIEWGKKDGIAAFQTLRYELLPLREVNTESMKLAINGTIDPRDIVEKICYKTGTLDCHDKLAKDVAKIFRDPQNYPLDITFKRLFTSDRNDNSDNSTDLMANINEIEVQGAGTPGANGTYKRGVDRRGHPSFVKKGRWQGGNETFVMFRDYGHWIIIISLPTIGRELYAGGYTELPCKTGWLVRSCGEKPGPTLQY